MEYKILEQNKIDLLDNMTVDETKSLLTDYVIEKKDLDLILKKLENKKAVILGGDVLKLKDDKYYPTYDNWFADPLKDESKDDYLNRSYKVTRDFVNLFKDEEVYFKLVIKSEDVMKE